MPTPNATNGMNPNAGMFDFGGGMNFNPMANGGAIGTTGEQNLKIAPEMPKAYNSSNPNQVMPGGTLGSGGYIPSWTPNSGSTSTPTSLTGTGNNNNLLPFYQGAYNFNPSTNLTNTFGNLGPYLLNMIQSGGYNPQVFQALVAQLQPEVNRGVATIGANAGANGTRFGSGYDLALGDYLSQVNLNESSMAAGLYEDSVKNSLAALGIAAGPQAQEKSNKGGFLSSLLSSIISPVTSLIPGLSSLGGMFNGGSSSNSDWGNTSSDPFGNYLNLS